MQCSNNLKQIGLALHNYASAHRYFPSGYLAYATRNGIGPANVGIDPDTWDAAPGWSWNQMILPFMEQANISDQLSNGLPIWDASHQALLQTKISGFLCPSSSGESDAFTVRDSSGNALQRYGAPIRLGRTNYVASHGQESCWGECGASATGIIFSNIYTSTTRVVRVDGDAKNVADGPFFRNSHIGFKDISDGTTNTIFVSEHSSRLSDKAWAGVVPGAVVHPKFRTPENGPDAAATLSLMHMGPSGGELDITGFPIIHPMNFPTYHVGQMYSEHPGLGNVLYGDGSVRTMPETIDLILAAELASMNEGEVPAIGDL